MLTEDYSSSPSTKHGQRRQVTVLFADMVGYTSLAEKLGEEQTYHLMQQVHKELHEAIHAHSGTVQENTGDGIMALFGAPVAVENAPLHACRAAIDLQTRIKALAQKINKDHGLSPAFRVGIHSGPLVVGEVGDDRKSAITALGDTVNLASRIEAQAGAGEIFLSDATHTLVQSFVTSRSAGEREIKGKADPQKLWALDAVKGNISTFDVALDKGLTPFIGRGTELAKLETLWSEVSHKGLGAVIITGEAGSGKSRLVHELHQRIGDEKALFLEGHCDSGNQGKPFAPLIEVIRSSFRISPDASVGEARQKLAAGLEILGIDPSETQPYLMHVLGYRDNSEALADVAHETLGIRIRDAILHMLSERCHLSPTVILLDGMQWADSASEELIARCIDQLQALPLLLIITARSGYAPPWADAPGVQQVHLAGLPEQDMTRFSLARLGVTEAPDGVTQLITDKAQGNPLFAEEIIEHLTKSGAVTRAEGGLTLAGDVAGFTLPTTVENLMMDQFDQLLPGPRALLEVASVIGARFSKTLAVDATGNVDDADAAIALLADKDLIQSDPGGKSYSFSKTLARDAIYDSMLTPRRQSLHRQVAEALENAKDAYPDEIADQLAYHWARSDAPARAIRHMARAGEAALRIYALEEADQHFTKALNLIEDPATFEDPLLLADIFLNYARVLYFKVDFYRVLDIADHYSALFENLDDKARHSRFLFEVGYMQVFTSNVEMGRETLAQARKLGVDSGDDLAVAYADLGLMWESTFWGTFSQARIKAIYEVGERIVSTGLKHGDTWLASKAYLALSMDRSFWGHPDEAHQISMKLMAMSRETNDPRPKSMAFYNLAAISNLSGDYDTAIEQAEEALRISLSPIDRGMAQGMKAVALIFKRDAEEGLRIGLPPLEHSTRGGNVFNTSIMRMIMGVGKLMQGDLTLGMDEVLNAWQEPIEWGQSITVPIGEMVLAEVYLEMAVGEDKPSAAAVLGNMGFVLRNVPFAKSKARSGLEKSIQALRDVDATSHVARALINLARLDIAAKKSAMAKERLDEALSLAQSVSSEGLTRMAQEQLRRI